GGYGDRPQGDRAGFGDRPQGDRGPSRNGERTGGFRRDSNQRNDRREGPSDRFGTPRPARSY
ncbi:MAG TPA: RNA helicase, partial [Actinoplanes sp.]|nr:RNA helicase [Actinoplanes sp.]